MGQNAIIYEETLPLAAQHVVCDFRPHCTLDMCRRPNEKGAGAGAGMAERRIYYKARDSAVATRSVKLNGVAFT